MGCRIATNQAKAAFDLIVDKYLPRPQLLRLFGGKGAGKAAMPSLIGIFKSGGRELLICEFFCRVSYAHAITYIRAHVLHLQPQTGITIREIIGRCRWSFVRSLKIVATQQIGYVVPNIGGQFSI